MRSVTALRGGILAPALSFLEQGDVDRAFKAYRALRKQQPNNAGIIFNFANALTARRLFEQAEPEYREALKLERYAPDIVNNLAAVTGEQGRHEEAVELATQGLAKSPNNAALLRTRSTQLMQMTKLDEALKDADDLLIVAPGMAEAHNLKGEILARQSKWDDAIAKFKDAIASDDRAPQYRANLGAAYAARGSLAEAAAEFTAVLKIDKRDVKTINALAAVLQRMNRHQDAIRACQLALSVQPDYAEAHNRMAQSYLSMEKWKDAMDTARAVLERHPAHQEALFNLGLALIGGRRYAEAVECFDDLLKAGPSDDIALLNLGNALAGAGRVEDALGAYTRMIDRKPDWAGGFLNRGHVYGKMRRWDEALSDYNQALVLEPNKTGHRYSIGNIYLHQGDFERGLPGYEYRNESNDALQQRFAGVPVWQGEDLSGKHIVVFGEQGLGDNIQMARYLALLQQRGARVGFYGYPMLRALFQTAAPGLELIDNIEGQNFDYQVATMSLPLRFGTRVDSVPQNIPYFTAEPDRIARWREQIGTQGFKIGINWQGNPSGKIDEGRSAPLKQFLRFAAIPGVRLVSLQKNHGLDQLNDVPGDINIHMLGDGFDTGKDAFLDTVAVLANLDLVVTTDTSLVHVAGGFGARSFVAIKDNPDWRWMYDRDDSPWYPSIRLFRQTEFAVWDDVFTRMTEEIRALVEQSR